MAEEDFHEIQLNGKQLVFLFMTGTVAAVVIFLCGLMVGRNLRVPGLEAAAVTAGAAIGDPTRPAEDLPPPATASESTKPATINEELTYSEHLEAPNPIDEPLRNDFAPAAGKTAEKRVENPADKPALAAKPASASQTRTSAEPASAGWTVQVQAVNSRPEADAIAKRLNAKGYPAFVTPRGAGNLVKYGIRVGKYSSRQDAEAMKTRLEKQEQFKPWVTH
jgi:cell division septation protein DedD